MAWDVSFGAGGGGGTACGAPAAVLVGGSTGVGCAGSVAGVVQMDSLGRGRRGGGCSSSSAS
eukprot:7770285-Prorocentrum_lima.AAC.1